MTSSLQEETAALLDAKSIPYSRRPHSFKIVVNTEMIAKNTDLFKSLAGLVKKSWES